MLAPNTAVTGGGRISEDVFKVVSGMVFGVAILAAVTRTAIRIHLKQRLQIDDGFLFLACVCLIATTILLYKMVTDIYFFQSLSSDPSAVAIPMDIVSRIDWFQKSDSAYLFVTWTAIFAVKFSFLAFFRRLIDRLGSIIIYWKVVIGFTASAFAFCVCDGFIACPQRGLSAIACTKGKLLDRAVLLGAIAISLDILTDIMIVSIPIWVLWKVKIKRRQKLGLGVFLCLNVCMAIIACIRVAGIRYQGTLDHSWNYFWQQTEVCMAVSMVSFTAFRSLFVSDKSNAIAKKPKPWYSSPIRMFGGTKKEPSADEDSNGLPSIPSATLTGMRTFIRGNDRFSKLNSEARTEYTESILLQDRVKQITVSQGLSTEVQEVA